MVKLNAGVKQCVRFIHESTKKLEGDIGSGPKAPFKTPYTGSDRTATFEKNMPFNRRVKAWERDNMDKDEWFKEKYAWKHSLQKKAFKEKGYRRRSKGDDKRHYKEQNVMQSVSQLKLNPLVDYLYGTNPVLAALRSSKRTDFGKLHLHNPKKTPKDESIIALANSRGINIIDTTKQNLNRMTDNGVHNGIVLETRPLDICELKNLGKPSKERINIGKTGLEDENTLELERDTNTSRFPVGIYLDEISDPHNVGAIIRSAYFLGVDFIVLSSRNCASLTPLVSKASSGAMEFIPIFYALKPLSFFEESAANGWSIVSTLAPQQIARYSNKAVDRKQLHELVQESPVLLVIGSEGDGIRTNLVSRSTHVVGINPARAALDNSVDSLNVSVATALLISQLVDE